MTIYELFGCKSKNEFEEFMQKSHQEYMEHYERNMRQIFDHPEMQKIVKEELEQLGVKYQ